MAERKAKMIIYIQVESIKLIPKRYKYKEHHRNSGNTSSGYWDYTEDYWVYGLHWLWLYIYIDQFSRLTKCK